MAEHRARLERSRANAASLCKRAAAAIAAAAGFETVVLRLDWLRYRAAYASADGELESGLPPLKYER